MNQTKLIIALAVLALFATDASAKNKPVSKRDQEQAACYDDVMKLCGNAVPDEAKVTACMADKKAMVSAKCAAFYDAD